MVAVSKSIHIQVPMPSAMQSFKLPIGVQRRLSELLDRQELGQRLSPTERREAEGLVEMAEFLSLLKLRTKRTGKREA